MFFLNITKILASFTRALTTSTYISVLLTIIPILLTITYWIVTLLYRIGLVKLALQAGDESKKFSVKTLLNHKWSEIWKSVIAPLVFRIMMIIPIILVIGILLGGIGILSVNSLSQLPATITQNPAIS